MHPSRRTWRVRGVPLDFDKKKLADVLRHHPDLQFPNDVSPNDTNGDDGVLVHTLAPDLRFREKVATIRFHNLPTQLDTLESK